MTIFNEIKKRFQENFKQFIKDQTNLFVTGVDKDTLWNTYLSSFPDADRQEFTCNSCRQFIKNYANVVKIENNKVIELNLQFNNLQGTLRQELSNLIYLKNLHL